MAYAEGKIVILDISAGIIRTGQRRTIEKDQKPSSCELCNEC
jgi:ubiquinone/menaquinone biosynthesis C-methylase UbiE